LKTELQAVLSVKIKINESHTYTVSFTVLFLDNQDELEL